MDDSERSPIGRLVRRLGFSLVASGPFVRSSYHAGEMATETRGEYKSCAGRLD